MLDSLASGRPGDEILRVARLVLDGYQRFVPLEERELAMVGELWATRSAVGVAIGSWRARQGLEEPEFAERLNEARGGLMEHLLTTGWDGVAHRLGAADRTPRPSRVLPSSGGGRRRSGRRWSR